MKQSIKSTSAEFAGLALMALLRPLPAVAEGAPSLKAFFSPSYLETLAILPALTLLGLLAAIVYVDGYIRGDQKKTLGIIIAAVLSLIAQNWLEYRLSAGQGNWLARTLVGIYGYAVRPVVIVLFLRLIAPEKSLGWAWILTGINAAVNSTALFSHLCFWIDESNHFHVGPLGSMCLLVSMALLFYLFILTLRMFHPQKRKETLVPMLVVVLIILGVMQDYKSSEGNQPVTWLTIAVVISCVIYYIWLHLQFVREHEQALQAEQRIQIMMTQIQPHFLFNTIATIRALCRRDAEKAGEVAEKFGDYLRQNLDSLGTAGLIPFRKELEHTKVYAEIEMVRFQNIRVEYDIQEDGFSVPPLTVQPLVENAIRHGVRIRDEGVVRVSARRCENGYEIVVWDNGVGFDVERAAAAGDAHIGLRNVRERLESMCGGSLRIESQPDVGTKVTIVIPAQVKKEQ